MSQQQQPISQPSGLTHDGTETTERLPRLSEPLSFTEPPPTTTIGRISYILREILHIGRHILYTMIYGVTYDMTPAELERHIQQQQARLPNPAVKRYNDMVLLGYIRSTYQLMWLPNSSTVTLYGEVVVGEEDVLAHAVKAYEHLGSVVDDEHSRLVKYTGQSEELAPSSNTSRTFPTFEYLPYGSLQSFLLTTQSHPYLSHSSIPAHAATSALVLHWLLNLASALATLHSHSIAHCGLSLEVVWLRADFSAALFDLTNSILLEHDDESEEDTAVQAGGSCWGAFQFPTYDLDTKYWSAATAEDAMAFGKAMDVFDFGTVAWRLLSRTVKDSPDWQLPTRTDNEPEWSLSEFRDRLREAVRTTEGDGRYGPLCMDIVRNCWTLEYKDGQEVLEALQKSVLNIGLKLKCEDETEGLNEAVEEFKDTYKPNSYLGSELWHE